MNRHIKQHQLACDLRRARLTAVALLVFTDRAIQRAAVEVIDVPAVSTCAEPLRDPARDEAIEEGANVLAVADAREGLVLPTQAIAAVYGDGDEKSGLPLGEAERRDGVDALVTPHPSHSS